MKICAAQTKPVKGDIAANITRHKKLVQLALTNGADMIIFPELSITGYEPQLANELATDQDDTRFDDFQKISDANNIIIGTGVPTKSDAGIRISMVVFLPHKPRQTYSKQYLHDDELPYFVPGQQPMILEEGGNKISIAICYEVFVTRHSAKAYESGAGIYLASVAKSAAGIEKANKSLPAIAKEYSMTVLMSNCTGHCDNFESAGQTSAWNSNGVLAGQLNATGEGIIMIDTVTGEVMVDYEC